MIWWPQLHLRDEHGESSDDAGWNEKSTSVNRRVFGRGADIETNQNRPFVWKTMDWLLLSHNNWTVLTTTIMFTNRRFSWRMQCWWWARPVRLRGRAVGARGRRPRAACCWSGSAGDKIRTNYWQPGIKTGGNGKGFINVVAHFKVSKRPYLTCTTRKILVRLKHTRTPSSTKELKPKQIYLQWLLVTVERLLYRTFLNCLFEMFIIFYSKSYDVVFE